MLSKHYQTQDHSNPHLGLCFFNSYITTAKSTAATLGLCNREHLGMKTSTGNQEEWCLNPSAAVSLLYAHTSPVIPRKHEAQTTQLHHLSPASPGAPLPCLHAQPSLLQAYFGTKPPPHSAASRQQMSPLGAVWVCVPSPKPPRQRYTKPWRPTICFLLLQSMISAPGWEIQSCCCLSWRDSRTRQNINGERQSCSKRQSRGWNPYPPGQPHILLQDNWGGLLRHPSISWIQWL